MKRKAARLTLTRETLRYLDRDFLGTAAGAVGTETCANVCGTSVCAKTCFLCLTKGPNSCPLSCDSTAVDTVCGVGPGNP
jgi:hypothetical protein